MSRRDRQELIFKALANDTRRKILDFLKDGPETTGAICEHFRKRDRCTIMQHLRVLEKSELIIVKRKGRERWNYLNALPIKEIYDRWISKYARISLELLSQLKRDIENMDR